MRWMLLAYMRRWLTIATALFLGIEPSQALASEVVHHSRRLRLGLLQAVVVTVCAACSYLLLGADS